MTKDQIALRAHNYTKRINALNKAIEILNNFVCCLAAHEEVLTLNIMLSEYTLKLESLSVNKEYMISFEGGGWNTTHATNDEDALKFAKAEFDSSNTKVASVRLSTPDGMEAALRSFY